MNKYWLIFKQSINEVLEYRTDFLLSISKYSIMILIMIFVWTAVQQASQSPIYNLGDIVKYFFLAAIIYSLSNFHPYYIEDDIKLGGLNKYLTKPLQPMSYYFVYEAAKVSLETLIRTIILLPVVYLLGYHFQFIPLQFIFFCLYLPLIFVFSFNLLATISITAFWITESSALRWAILIIVRFLSGVLVPIAFFSPTLQSISQYLPFQQLAFIPIQLMLSYVTPQQIIYNFFIFVSWTIAIVIFRLWFWRQGLKIFEGTGI
jgi:ABC-2 type transport system permease protein